EGRFRRQGAVHRGLLLLHGTRVEGRRQGLERPSIGWTDGTFARPTSAQRERSEHAEGGGGRGREASLGGLRPPKTKSERAKVPLPLHKSDERSGFSRGSRDFVALLATCLLLPKRRTQLQSAIERSSIGWTDGTFACRTSAER